MNNSNRAVLYPNGPIILHDVTVENEEGVETYYSTVAICRCGHSNTKPKCDGSHRNVGYHS